MLLFVNSWAGWVRRNLRGGFRLFGPLLWYDLVRTARRKQPFLLRCLYAALLLAALFIVHASWVFSHNAPLQGLFTGMTLDSRTMADFASSFFLAFLAVQFLAACVLTPICTAGAITEEKETRALEFLLATDLRNREIVLSLAASRLANLGLVILSGLPVLGLMQLLGGVDPLLLLSGFAATGITMTSLTGLGMVASVYAHLPRQAILRTYGCALAYLALSGFSWVLTTTTLGWASFPSTASWTSPVTVEDLVYAFNYGNPVAMVVQLWEAMRTGGELADLLPAALGKYALFHGLAAAGLIAWAIFRLRVVVLTPSVRRPVRYVVPGTVRRRPRLRNHPLLWKELFAAAGPRLRWLGRIQVALLISISFLPALGIWYYFSLGVKHAWDWDPFAEAMNVWVRGASAVVACFMLLGVALRAAGSVSGERDRQTIDGLLTTPTTAGGILFAKWLGSIGATRWVWLWLALVWVAGIFSGGLDFRLVPALVLACFVVAAFLASLGLWFSVGGRSTGRALFGTFLTTAFLTAGHWLLWAFVVPLAAMLGSSALASDRWFEFEALGLTPAFTIAWLAFPTMRSGAWSSAEWEWARTPLLQGLLFWGLGAVVLWLRAYFLFRKAVNRAPTPQLSLAAQNRGGEDVRSVAGIRFWRRRARWLTAGALALVCLALYWYGFRGASSGDALAEALAEADRLDPGWQLDDLEASRKVIPDEQNGAFQVPAIPDERSFARKPRWYPGKQWPRRATEKALEDLAPEVRLTSWQLRLLTQDMEDVEAALVQARRMVDYPDGRNPISYSKDGIGTLLPFTHRPRSIVSLLAHDALLRAEEGDVDGALTSCHAAINAGRILGDEPTVISMLVRLSCRMDALARIERALAQGEPSEAALAALQKHLEMEEQENLLLTGFRGERALLDRFMKSWQEDGMGWRNLRQYQGWFNAQPSWKDRVMLWAGLSVAGQRTALLRYGTRAVESAKAPLEQQLTCEAELKALAKGLPPFAHGMIGSPERTVYETLLDSFRRNQTLLRCAIVATALERYRRARGHWPDSLDVLVPDLLRAVPKDPYDGQPLRYRRRADGVVIYAVGLDGKDDGGTKLLRPFVRPPKPEEWAGVDLGMRLWNPDQRRQPAPPGVDLKPDAGEEDSDD